jgi:diphosphomevalonate decarboxylase
MTNKVGPEIIVSCECAPNIALIKYWGKSNEELILPLNGSISITLDSKVLSSRTCLVLSKIEPINEQTTTIQITLDGKTQTFRSSEVALATKSDLINRKRFIILLNKVRVLCLCHILKYESNSCI